jgi:hypothetical protein
MSLLPFHFFFSLDSPLLPQAVRPPPSWGTAPPSPRPGRRRPDPRRRCAVPQPRSNRLLQLHHAVDPHGVQRTSPRCGGGSASAADADASRRQHERRGPPADNLRLRPDGALVVLHVQPPPSIAAGLNPGPIPFGGPSYLHVFLLAPLMVYNATTRGAGYYAQWCYTLGIGSQGSLIPLWVA